MKLQFITTGKKVETVNYILGQAIKSLKANPRAREALELSEKEVEEAEKFRKQMVDGYLR